MIYSLITYDNSLQVTGVISFSSVVSGEESYANEVTESTVEQGFKITDHIFSAPFTTSLEVFISSYSIFNESLELFWNGTDFSNTAFDSGADFSSDHLEVKNLLKEVATKRKLFTLVVSKEDSYFSEDQVKADDLLSKAVDAYSNCVLTGLSFPTNSSGSEVVNARLQIRQIKVAKAKVKDISTKSVKMVTPIKASATNGSLAQGKKADGTDIGGVEAKDKTKNGVSKGISKEDQAISNANKGIVDDINSSSKAYADRVKRTLTQNGYSLEATQFEDSVNGIYGN